MTRLVPTALCLLAFAATSFADDAPTPAPLPPPPPAPAPLVPEVVPAPGATVAPAGTASPTPSPATPPAASLPAPAHLPAGAALPATLAPAGTSSATATPTYTTTRSSTTAPVTTPTVNASPSPVRYAAPAAPRTSVPVVASSSASSLGEIAKQHNLDMGGGTMAVRLVVPVDAIGLRSETLAVVIRFYDAVGRPISSVFPTWADSTGQLRVVSGEYVPAAARDRASFAFDVPYGAFPRDPAGLHAVEARATLVQRTPTGRRVLAVRSTRFFVE